MGYTVTPVPSVRRDVFVLVLAFRVGAVDETPQQAGISHVLEHMLFESKEKHGIVKTLADTGVWNAETGLDYTYYYAVTHPRVSEQTIVNMLAVVARFGRLSDALFERERRVVLEEIGRIHKDTEAAATAALLQGTPYANLVQGTRRSIGNMSVASVRDFYNAYYKDVHVVLGCGAPGVQRASVALVHSLLQGSRFVNNAVLPRAVVLNIPHQQNKTAVVMQKLGAAGVALCVAVRTVAWAQRSVREAYDVYAFTAKRQLLRALRHERGLIYSCDVQHDSYMSTGVLRVKLASSVARADELVSLCLRVLSDSAVRVRDPSVWQQRDSLQERTHMTRALTVMRDVMYKDAGAVGTAADGPAAVLAVATRQRTTAAMRSGWDKQLLQLCSALRKHVHACVGRP